MYGQIELMLFQNNFYKGSTNLANVCQEDFYEILG